MSIKSSINKVSNIRVLFFFIFLIITKIECWPVFKQDPLSLAMDKLSKPTHLHNGVVVDLAGSAPRHLIPVVPVHQIDAIWISSAGQ